jgi:chromosome partitioning protein
MREHEVLETLTSMNRNNQASLDVEGLVLTLEALGKLGSTNCRVLITKARRRRKTRPSACVDLTSGNIPLFGTDIPLLKCFDKATAAGVTVNEVDDPRAERAWNAYAAVGKEVLEYGQAK